MIKKAFMKYANSILETIGNTPLIKLNRVVNDIPCLVLLKNEAMNPGNSVKDRAANYMVAKAEETGSLLKGGTIIEATSGNTGIALAMVAAAKGYKMISVLTDKHSAEKVATLKALGSKVIICPSNVKHNESRSQYSVAKRTHERTPNSWFVNQHNNQSNVQSHYNTTGPEIWEQTEGKVTHVIAAVSTGGTLCGTAKYLKEQNANIKIWAIDAYGSVLKKYKDTGIFDDNQAYPYQMEGIGADFIPKILDFELIDGFIKVTDKDSALLTRDLASKEGLFLGNTAGASIKAVHDLKNQFTKDDVVVVITNDHGSRYFSKVHNEDWIDKQGYLKKPATTAVDLVKDIKTDVITVKTTELVAHAVERMRKYKISQIPVVDNKGFVGSVDEMSLFKAFLDDHRKNDTPIESIMNPSFPIVNSFTSVEEVTDLIRKGNTAVIVALDNEKHGIITKSDVINHIQ